MPQAVVEQPEEEKVELPPAPTDAAADKDSEKATFECTLNKGGAKLGLELDYWSRGIQITRLVSGGIDTYNSGVPEERQLLKHHFLLKVNGETKVENMKEKLLQNQVLTVTVARPMRLRIRIERAPGGGDESPGGDGSTTWGVRLQHQVAKSTCLQVSEVLPGALQAHNDSALPELQIKRFDFIESVNNISDNSHQMFEEFKKQQVVELVVLRVAEFSDAA